MDNVMCTRDTHTRSGHRGSDAVPEAVGGIEAAGGFTQHGHSLGARRSAALPGHTRRASPVRSRARRAAAQEPLPRREPARLVERDPYDGSSAYTNVSRQVGANAGGDYSLRFVTHFRRRKVEAGPAGSGA